MRPNVPPSKDHDGRSETDAFSNEWVVHLVGGGDVADLIALRLGYVNVGEVRMGPCIIDWVDVDK